MPRSEVWRGAGFEAEHSGFPLGRQIDSKTVLEIVMAFKAVYAKVNYSFRQYTFSNDSPISSDINFAYIDQVILGKTYDVYVHPGREGGYLSEFHYKYVRGCSHIDLSNGPGGASGHNEYGIYTSGIGQPGDEITSYLMGTMRGVVTGVSTDAKVMNETLIYQTQTFSTGLSTFTYTMPTYEWILFDYIEIPDLLTNGVDRVDFNKLTPDQKLAAEASPSLYHAQGGADVVTLPNTVSISGILKSWTPAQWFYAENGHDRVTGMALRDWIDGGDGNDRLTGNGGRDRLKSADGTDSQGTDILEGGDGLDEFIVGDGDLILDLQKNEKLIFDGQGSYFNIRPLDKSFTRYEVVLYDKKQEPAHVRPEPKTSIIVNLDEPGSLKLDHRVESGYWLEAEALEPWQKLIKNGSVTVANKSTEDPGLEQLYRVNPDILDIIDDVAAAYRSVLGGNYVLNITDVERPVSAKGQHPHSNALDFGIKYNGTQRYIENEDRIDLIKAINKDPDIPNSFKFFLSTKYNGGPIENVDIIPGTRTPGNDKAIFDHHHHLHVQAPAGYTYDWTV